MIEAVVELDLTRRSALGDRPAVEKARARLAGVYALPAESRLQAAEEAYAGLFAEYGHDRLVHDALKRFPEFSAKLEKVAVTPPDHGEGCTPDREGKRLHVRLRPERFFDPGSILFLDREMLHAADMVDPAYAYRFEAADDIVRERYALLWNIHVDARLVRRGLAPDGLRAGRVREFDRIFAKYPPDVRRSIFDVLWSRERESHAALLDMAKDPQKLVDLAPAAAGVRSEPLPGTRCPLCAFPTYTWIRNGALEPVAKAIAADFGEWTPERGVCERCFELYALRAGIW